jgi:hypothetical protein
MMNWKIVQRGFYAAGGAGTVILVFSAVLAIWDVFDIDTYWRALASIGVLIFTALVCAGTAALLEKFEKAPSGIDSALSPVEAGAAMWGSLRNAAGMFVISIFTLHGIFGFYAVWSSMDNLFMRAALSALTFFVGLLILIAFANAMQYGQKQASQHNSGLYVMLAFLTVALILGVSTL